MEEGKKRLLTNYIGKYIKEFGINEIKRVMKEIYEIHTPKDYTPSNQQTVITYTKEDMSDQRTLNFEEHKEFNRRLDLDEFEMLDFSFGQYASSSSWFDPVEKRYYDVKFVEDKEKIKLIREYEARK